MRIKKLEEMKTKDALWYLRWVLVGIIIAAIYFDVISDLVGVIFIIILVVIERVIALNDYWVMTSDLSLREAWSCWYYKPDTTMLYKFANKASGFIYQLSESGNEDNKDLHIQNLAQETRALLHDIEVKKVTLPHEVIAKLYFFIEKDKQAEIPNRNQINRKDFAMAVTKLANILDCEMVWNQLLQWNRNAFSECIYCAEKCLKN